MKNASYEAFAKKVALFHSLVVNGKKSELSEAQTRIEYIDPMFRALGWDVSNENALNQFDREVIVEEAISKREEDDSFKTHPDYTFKTSGQRFFFVEAKRPSVDIKQSQQAALQIRRYTWSAQLPAGVLTDFEELSLYDGLVPPRSVDDARKARHMYKSYTQYLDEWELLYSIFSRDAVLSGSLNSFSTSGAIPAADREAFDQAFLSDLEGWRLTIAEAIIAKNSLTDANLNAATQLLLDRIIFLRVAEARGVQPSNTPYLSDVLVGTGTIYSRLQKRFRDADERYNSGLFHFRAERGRESDVDQLTPKLTIDDAPLKDIISGLYPPESPYAFAAVPADILGSVYERFLGRTLTVDSNKKVRVELKPEVRKQGGVFYTPSFIVKYMINSTVGRWIEDHKVDDLRSIRICDPACGSGAFLVAAYEFVVAENIKRYLRRRDTTSKYLIKKLNGTYTLVSSEKKRVLKDCIFGFDIDPVAVEITKLSLLLAVLQDETRESVDRQLGLFQERALPDISENVICSNSLIETSDLDIADLDMIGKLKPMDWDTNKVTKDGFDILIGNPPYVFGEWHEAIQLRVLHNRLPDIRQIDLYHAFLEMVIRKRKIDGYWSLIVPDALLARDDTASIRRLILGRGDVVASHVANVFSEAAVSCVVMTQGPDLNRSIQVDEVPMVDGSTRVLRNIAFDTIVKFDDVGFRLSLDSTSAEILAKLKNMDGRVGDLLSAVSRGEELGKKDLLGVPSKETVPCVVGEDISAFSIRTPKYNIRKRDIRKSRNIYTGEKAITIKTGIRPKTAIDRSGYITLQSVYNLTVKSGKSIEIVAAVLNSSVASWYIKTMYTSYKKLFPQMNQRHISDIPLPFFEDEAMIVNAVRTLEVTKDTAQIQFLVKKIDQMVSDAYGLSKKQFDIIKSD